MKNNKLNVIKCDKRNKKEKLVDFIKRGLIDNGGNYQDICNKMKLVKLFSSIAPKLDIKCNFSKLQEACEDFFGENKEIVNFQQARSFYSALYQKKKNKKLSDYYQLSIMQQVETKKPIVFFGQHKKIVESHFKNTYLYFCDNKILFHDEYSANYEEIPLWGWGTHGEFIFDDNNKLIEVKTREMTEPRLKLWGGESSTKFEEGNILIHKNKQIEEKEARFVFDEENIDDVLRQIDVDYEESILSEEFVKENQKLIKNSQEKEL